MQSPTDPAAADTGNARLLFAVGALLTGLAVAAGAFGTHALGGRLPPGLPEVFETGVRYHLTQSLGVMGLALAAERWSIPALRAAGWLVVTGIFVFSGSLYLLVLAGTRFLGAVTPVGGVLLITGWVVAAVLVARHRGP